MDPTLKTRQVMQRARANEEGGGGWAASGSNATLAAGQGGGGKRKPRGMHTHGPRRSSTSATPCQDPRSNWAK